MFNGWTEVVNITHLHFITFPLFSPKLRRYPPACKPYRLEAEPEASIPPERRPEGRRPIGANLLT
jgi:hypothetical protein